MFISFDLVTVALALLGFYTYPVIVAVANVALGRETLDRPRIVALVLAVAGMVAVVASQLDPAAGIRVDAIGFGLALSAAMSQAGFVIISRTGYRAVPASQAMTVILATTVICGTVLALVIGQGPTLTFPIRRPVGRAAPAVHRAVRRRHPVDPVPDRDPADRRDTGRDPDALRAGRRGRPGRRPARRAPRADPGGRWPGHPRGRVHPAALGGARWPGRGRSRDRGRRAGDPDAAPARIRGPSPRPAAHDQRSRPVRRTPRRSSSSTARG